MRRLTLSFLIVLTFLFFSCTVFAQSTTSAATATCNFDADKQLAVEYQRISFNPKKAVMGREIPYGKVWAPGGKPMTLFTNSPVEIGGTKLSIGAYTMFVVPSQKQWTLIISKSTDMSGKYDGQQDVVKVPMESGELPSLVPEFSVSFEHVAPTQCNIRVDLEKTGNFATFQVR